MREKEGENLQLYGSALTTQVAYAQTLLLCVKGKTDLFLLLPRLRGERERGLCVSSQHLLTKYATCSADDILFVQ